MNNLQREKANLRIDFLGVPRVAEAVKNSQRWVGMPSPESAKDGRERPGEH